MDRKEERKETASLQEDQKQHIKQKRQKNKENNGFIYTHWLEIRTSTPTRAATVHGTSWQPGTHHSPFSTFSRCNALVQAKENSKKKKHNMKNRKGMEKHLQQQEQEQN